MEYPGLPEEWLNSLRDRVENQKQPQLYDLQNLTILGSVNGDRVELQVEALVEVRVPGEWVHVPLEFADFQLIEPMPEHSVKAPDSGMQRFEKNRLPLKSWLLRGKGFHTLKFHLIGQVRSTANGRNRIRITPPVANQSRLLLKLPGIIPAAELSTDKQLERRSDEAIAMSEIETWGLSEATEITWTPETGSTDQPITVQTTAPARMKLDLTTKPASLTIQQTLIISGGSIDNLTVRLPLGFANVAISGTVANNDPVVRSAVVSDAGAAAVEFVAPTTGAITLNYSLELAENASEVSIQLPDIERATNETADLDLIVPVGLEVDAQQPDDGSVRQRRVETAPENRGEGIAQVAYRLLSEKAKLKLSIKETEAFYSVVPLMNFETDEDSVLLTARFSVNVVRGSLNEMNIAWPGYEADGWKILDGYTRLVTDTSTINLAPPSDGNSVTVEFPVRQSRQFVIEVQALRALKTFQESNGLLFLPDIRTPTPHATTVSLIESDAHSMVLSSPEEDTAFPQLPPSRWPDILRQRDGQLTVWLVDSPDQAVNLSVTKQRPEIRASVLAEVSVANDTVRVSETLTYSVRHRDVSEVRLLVVNVPIPTVRLRDSVEPLPQLVTQDNVVTYSLPQAMRGEFELLVDFYWPPPMNPEDVGGQPIELPLVLPSSTEEAVESIQVTTNMPESIALRRSDDWTRIHSDTFSAAWSTTTVPASVPILLKHPLGSPPRNRPLLLIVNSALVGDSFVTSTTAVFSEPPGIIDFTVPSGCKVVGAALAGNNAQVDIIADDPGGQIAQIVPAPDTKSQSATATLVVKQNLKYGHQLLTTLRPLLPRPIDANRDCNCIWVLRQSTDMSVVHWAGTMSELDASTGTRPSAGSSGSRGSAIVDVLLPAGNVSRDDMIRRLEQSLADTGQYQLLVGPTFRQQQTLLLVSRRALLLATAIVGLLMYFTFVKLHPLPLITTVTIAAAAVTNIVALVPGPAHIILIRFVPGCVIAVIAAVLQRWFARKITTPLQGINSPDGSTIFTIDEPLRTQSTHDTIETA